MARPWGTRRVPAALRYAGRRNGRSAAISTNAGGWSCAGDSIWLRGAATWGAAWPWGTRKSSGGHSPDRWTASRRNVFQRGASESFHMRLAGHVSAGHRPARRGVGGWSCAGGRPQGPPSGCAEQPRKAWPGLGAHERVPAALRSAGRRNGRSAAIATSALAAEVALATPTGCASSHVARGQALGHTKEFRRPYAALAVGMAAARPFPPFPPGPPIHFPRGGIFFKLGQCNFHGINCWRL